MAPTIGEARRVQLASFSQKNSPSGLFSAKLIARIKSARPSVAFSLAGLSSPVPSANAASPVVPPPTDAPAVPLSAGGPFDVQDSQGRSVAVAAAGRQVKVAYYSGNYYLFGPNGFIKASAGPLRAVPIGSAIISLPGFTDWNWDHTLNLNSFRGVIEVRYSPVSKVLWAINELPLEDYLKGVSEASADAPVEHLKVMSIIERSYAWYHLNTGTRHQGEPFTLANSRSGNGDDQIYQGYLAETRLPRVAAAAVATAGEVVTYQGRPVITPYSSNPGGRTRSPQEAGWGNVNWPWVKSVPDPDTAGMARSGHGVGLSAYGSLKRAGRGESAQAILGYYFPGTAIGHVPMADKKIRISIYSVK